MWGKPPFYIPEGFALKVRDLKASRTWYKEKLGFRDGPKDVGDDSGNPYTVLQLRDGEILILVEAEQGSAMRSYGDVAPIFFAGNLGKAHAWLEERGVSVESFERDSGGNELFHFVDLDGNRLEVCRET
jgi:catechol 2,3-dioxygenase-like lactoylglutathione lyase family enzyme